MTGQLQDGNQSGVILSAAALSRSLEGFVLSRLLAETGLELIDALFISTPSGRGLAYVLAGENARTKTATLVDVLKTQLAAEISVALPADIARLPVAEPCGEGEHTLVLLKPDNFEYPSIRPGALLDHLARTGLVLAWMGIHHMSVAQAEEFYGPVLPVLEEAFKVSHGGAVVNFIEREFDETLAENDRDALQAEVGPMMGRLRWERLVEFMTGKRPSEATAAEKSLPGTRKCLALIYRGENAVSRIRDILGPTNPEKAPAGPIRREFGRALMINAAHASDSVENAIRELKILGIKLPKL